MRQRLPFGIDFYVRQRAPFLYATPIMLPRSIFRVSSGKPGLFIGFRREVAEAPAGQDVATETPDSASFHRYGAVCGERDGVEFAKQRQRDVSDIVEEERQRN